MNNLDLLFQASLLVESEKLDVVDKFSAISKDLKSSIGGRMAGWTILRELLSSAELTIQSTKESTKGKEDDTQLKRYLGDYSYLISVILQIYNQEAELLHAVKRQIIDVFSAKNQALQSYGKSSGCERKAQVVEPINKPVTQAMFGDKPKRCAPVQEHGVTETATRDGKVTMCEEAVKVTDTVKRKSAPGSLPGKNSRLKIRIPMNGKDKQVKVSLKVEGEEGNKEMFGEQCTPCDNLEYKSAKDDEQGKQVERGSFLKEDVTPCNSKEKLAETTKQINHKMCGAVTRSSKRNRKRRSLEMDNEGVVTKRRRINWTVEENKLFIELVSKFQALGEAEMRRRVAKHFSPRRTHEQCANHLRILRAKGVLPSGDDQVAAEGGCLVGPGRISRDTSVTLSKDSQSS